jgi:hypothetical protein
MSSPDKVKSVCIPLDPDDCGSVISGFVRYPEIETYSHGKKEQYIEYGASLALSDCSRVINWSLSAENSYDLDKLDRAIAALMEMRKNMSEAETLRKKLMIKVKAHNKIVNPKDE